MWATSSFRRSNRALRPSHTKLTLPKGALCDASLIPRVGGKTKRKRTPSRERQKFQPSRHRQIVRQPRNNRASLSPETLCAKGPFSHIRGAAGPDRISTWSDSLRGVVSRDLRKGQLCNSREGSAPLCPTESPHTQLEPPNAPSLSLSLSSPSNERIAPAQDCPGRRRSSSRCTSAALSLRFPERSFQQRPLRPKSPKTTRKSPTRGSPNTAHRPRTRPCHTERERTVIQKSQM